MKNKLKDFLNWYIDQNNIDVSVFHVNDWVSDYKDTFPNNFKEIGKNYTKPNLPNHEDDPKDWLATSLLFSKTIGHLLKPNEGIVIELENDMKSLIPNQDKVIVYHNKNQISIVECNSDFKDGQMVYLKNEDKCDCEEGELCSDCKRLKTTE